MKIKRGKTLFCGSTSFGGEKEIPQHLIDEFEIDSEVLRGEARKKNDNKIKEEDKEDDRAQSGGGKKSGAAS